MPNYVAILECDGIVPQTQSVVDISVHVRMIFRYIHDLPDVSRICMNAQP